MEEGPEEVEEEGLIYGCVVDVSKEEFCFHRANLPVRFHELNIHFGIWLGGLAGFNEIFLGNLPSFRGCMSHITYNNEDILLRAKTQNGQVSNYSVSFSMDKHYNVTSFTSPIIVLLW